MRDNIPAVFANQDTVYHYCTQNTAIEFILYEKKLRFSPRKSSFDPIENLPVTKSYGGVYKMTMNIELSKMKQVLM